MSENNKVDRYLERTFPGSHVGELRKQDERWLAQQEFSAGSIIRLERLRREEPASFLKIADAVLDAKTRPLLMVVANSEGGVSYDELQKPMNCSKRTVRDRTKELCEAGILDKINSKPVVVGPADEPTGILIEDCLSLFLSVRSDN